MKGGGRAVEVDPDGIACCFDGRTSRMLANYRRRGLGKTAAAVLDFIASRQTTGMTSLELGSGVGALTIELARRGMSAATGIDLSPEMIRAARALASESGLEAHVSFIVGDGATSHLRTADVVILDAVLCCYPDVEALVNNSTAAASRFYAISIPDDRLTMTRLLRPLLPLQRLLLRGTTFRFFLHPVSAISRRVTERGFTKVFEKRVGMAWSVLVYEASVKS